jgi:hypothetical protein
MDGQSEPNQNNPIRGNISDRFERREARRQVRYGNVFGTVIGGAFLICLGAALLLEQSGQFNLDRYGPLLILFPAAAAFWKAYRDYKAAGRLNGQATFALIGGLVLCLVTATLFFDLNAAILGPIAIILIGVGVLMRRM